jgi:RNA recognition motif-containing protein
MQAAPMPRIATPPQQGGGLANPEPEGTRNLMVNYIPTTIDELQLRQLFEMYGPVESVKIVLDRETRSSRGYGFVKYRFAFSAMHAIQYLNGYPLINKRLKVAYANHDSHQRPQQATLPQMQAQAQGSPPVNGSMDGHPDANNAWVQQQQPIPA